MNLGRDACWLVALLLAGCASKVREPEAGSVAVATAFGHALTKDSLAHWVPDDLSLEDSAQFAERVIERWMREQTLLAHAQSQLQGERASIKAALIAYRNSLVINTYETRFVEGRLNRNVTPEAIEAYHAAHPELFTLSDHAVRVLFAHLPDPEFEAQAKGLPWTRSTQKDWEGEQDQVLAWMAQPDSATIPALERWCIERGAMHHVDVEAWWTLGELLDEVPLSLYRVEDQIQRNDPLTFVSDGKRYFLRFLDHGLKGRTAPVEAAKDQITELILQNRRREMLEALRDTLVQEAWNSGELTRENL